MTDQTPRGHTHPAVGAVVVTVDPLLAVHLAGLHTGAHTAVLTRLPGTAEGPLRDTDALLVLDGRLTPDGTNVRPTTVYVGTDLDDATVWGRAVKLRADHVVVLPDPDAEAELRRWLREHLHTTA